MISIDFEMRDKRHYNGGNSTKAKGTDLRRNEYRQAVADATNEEEIKNVIQMLYQKAIDRKCVKASELFLSYVVGKPTEIDFTASSDIIPELIYLQPVYANEIKDN